MQTEVDDRPVTDDEVFAMVDLLLSGGVGTTASLVSNTVVWLYQHPDVRQDLIDHPEKMDRAIEEFVRFFSPTQGLARTVTKDVEFEGCPMKKGDRVLLAWASANRDPEALREPRRARHRALAEPAHARSASASTVAPARTSAARWPGSCSARSSTG